MIRDLFQPHDASWWVSNALLWTIWLMIGILAITMARISIVLTQLDIAAKVAARAKAAAEAEAKWPEYVINEEP